MKPSIEMQIKEYEKRLQEAMLSSDILELDELLADDIAFTNHLGQLMTKDDDLQAHKSKTLQINKITLSEQKIKILTGLAIVTVKAHVVGSFNGSDSENYFRFTRVWCKTSTDSWQLIAGHSSVTI